MFPRETNTCQDQPQFEHEIFQTNVRPQNSHESNSQKKLKTFIVGNLNKNTSEKLIQVYQEVLRLLLRRIMYAQN